LLVHWPGVLESYLYFRISASLISMRMRQIQTRRVCLRVPRTIPPKSQTWRLTPVVHQPLLRHFSSSSPLSLSLSLSLSFSFSSLSFSYAGLDYVSLEQTRGGDDTGPRMRTTPQRHVEIGVEGATLIQRGILSRTHFGDCHRAASRAVTQLQVQPAT
jgi:hypothetical protein